MLFLSIALAHEPAPLSNIHLGQALSAVGYCSSTQVDFRFAELRAGDSLPRMNVLLSGNRTTDLASSVAAWNGANPDRPVDLLHVGAGRSVVSSRAGVVSGCSADVMQDTTDLHTFLDDPSCEEVDFPSTLADATEFEWTAEPGRVDLISYMDALGTALDASTDIRCGPLETGVQRCHIRIRPREVFHLMGKDYLKTHMPMGHVACGVVGDPSAW